MLSNFLSKKQIPGRIIVARVAGSQSYGLATEGSDYDFAGVYQLPTQEILSLKQHKKTIDGKSPDYCFHEIGKFCLLLLKGNPSIIEMVFSVECEASESWDLLRQNKNAFLTRRSVEQYKGYANGQLHRLERGEYLHTTGGKYNTKWATHMLRLLKDALSIKSGNGLTVKKTGEDRDFLLDVKKGKYSQEEVSKMALDLLAKIDATESRVPEEADHELLNDWLLRCRRDFW